MHKIKYCIVLLALSSFLLSGCGGSSDDEVTDNTTDKEDAGQLELVSSDVSSPTDSLLNIKGIQKNNIAFDLNMLKVCTETKCWDIIDDNQYLSVKSLKASRITNTTNTVDIGTYNLSGLNEDITSLEYVYNNKEGKLELVNPIKPNQLSQKELYLDLAENISIPFSSLSIEYGRNGLFIPNEDFEKEFADGVILKVDKDTTDKMAQIFIKKIGKTSDSFIEINSYLIKFYAFNSNLDDLSDTTNDFPDNFSKEIDVKVPIDLTSISFDEVKNNYILSVNALDVEFDISETNNQHYLSFKSKSTSLQTVLFNIKNGGVAE